ncbi:MAG: HEAT repeat domain-containing protein [Candidatus Pacearchaeota archaeon]|nr:MAG: HEAT repeat domain-containing protein [Candidatus Pacearchaeota archaeon]
MKTKTKTIRTIFFVLLLIVVIVVAYIVFFRLDLFKSKVNEELMDQTTEIVTEFDGVNIYTLSLDKIVALGEPGIYALAEIYKNESSKTDQRWAAIIGISAIGHDLDLSDKVLPYLKDALDDSDVNVRVTAATLVLSHGSKDGIPILIAELDNDATLKPSEPPLPVMSYCALMLIDFTGQDYGVDKTQWQSWWDTNKDTFSLE